MVKRKFIVQSRPRNRSFGTRWSDSSSHLTEAAAMVAFNRISRGRQSRANRFRVITRSIETLEASR